MKIEILQPEGLTLTLALRHSVKDMYVAWAWCEWICYPNAEQPHKIRVWLIKTADGYRRRGYARKVIKFLKQEKGCDIETDLGPLGHAGTELFLKEGFKILKGRKKGEVDRLVWTNSQEKSA